MTFDRQVLVVDHAEGTLTGVMDELDLLGFRTVWVPTLGSALEFVSACPRLVLVVVSAAIADRGGPEFLARIKEAQPSLRIIWGTRSDATHVSSESGSRADSLLSEPFHPDALRDAVSSLLTEHLYPKAIAEAVQTAALEVLGTMGDFSLASSAFLVANQTTLSDYSSIVAFGGEASGHLLLGMTTDDVRTLYRRFLPGSKSMSIDRLEDLVGEVCNRILGRIGAFFAQHELSVQPTTPIFIRAGGSSIRFPGRHPSYGFQLAANHVRVSLEYYLADFDRLKLVSSTSGGALRMGEILYL